MADGCWIWTGGKTVDGYGLISRRRRDYPRPYAHRFSWELSNGKSAEGFEVCHKCDTPSCVNPEHLFLGTHRQNIDDARAKGRFQAITKLSEENARAILDRYKAGGITYRKLGIEYGVSESTVHHIVKGLGWKHLTR